MKILFSISGLGSGGAEKVASLLVNQLAMKHEILLMTRVSRTTFFYPVDPRVKIVELIDRPAATRLKKIVSYTLRLRNQIVQENPDVIISFMTENNISVSTAKLLSGKKSKLIISERTDPTRHIASLGTRIFRRVTYLFVDKLVVQTTNVQKWAESFMFPGKTKVIPNPFSLSELQLNSQKEMVANTPYILSIGRLTKEKGHDLLLEAFRMISSKVSQDLVIVGEGAERRDLESKIIELGLEGRVHVKGNKSNVYDYYAEADLFVLPSRYEGFPNALGEALICGTPAVSFDCPSGPSDILQGSMSKYLVEPENVGALAHKMLSLLVNPACRQEFKEFSSHLQSRFSLEKIIKSWEALF